ncbi:MAG: hypothetical protein GEV07_07625 [Streptosporangiales bacterium]|nr:hypothetical protein [Streptosporangiales bacterium]
MGTEELATIPGLRRLYLKGAAGLIGRHGVRLPDRELVVREVTVDPARLAAYNRVCGFRLTDRLAGTYPHVLAFPLQVTHMADRAFPFPLPGLVHIRNSITVLQPIDLAAPLTLRVHAERIAPHPRGAQVDLVSQAYVDGETVWLGRSTYLARGRSVPQQAATEPITEPMYHAEREVPEQTTAVWRPRRDLGRRYADVSGDVNPIHLGRVRARMFGFARPIAHGMWTKARCLAAFEGRLPDTYLVEVEFKKPVPLPSPVEFASEPTDNGWLFGVRSRSGAPHLVGRIAAR